MKPISIFLLLVLCSLPSLFFAQDQALGQFTYIQIDSTKQMWGDWNEPNWLRYFGLDAGDVNRDGNLDIISGRYIYHNPGGSMQGKWQRSILDDNVDAILSMNIDNDAFADIIAMALPNLYWYEATNLEGTKYNRTLIGQVPATSHVNSQGFEKAQIISGGLSEFVIAGDGDIYAVEIPAQNQAEVGWKIKMICQNTSDEGIGVGDIDGDGDLDIAAGRRAEGEAEPKILVWFENPGHIDALWKPTVVGESVHPIDRVEVADINNDGKTDIVVTEERYPGLDPDANIWWFGQNTLNNWSRNKITEQYSTNNLDITDFDEDGDIDLLTAEHKGRALELQLWSNDGEGNFTKTVFDTGKENHLGAQWVDLDNDGDLDIIGAGWDNHNYMHVWKNDAVAPLATGMLFKDHSWVPTMVSDKGKFLRVGGRLDYKVNDDHFPKAYHKEGFISLDDSIDLENAIKAEVFVERVQSHEDTKDLRVQFNDGAPIPLPEPMTIPDPAADYMFHSNIKVPVPLKDLKHGDQNRFRFSIDPNQKWDWPQNIIYGLVLRVYYGNSVKKEKSWMISGVKSGDTLGPTVTLSLSGENLENIANVDYVGLYEDVNVQGDGQYLQWQYRFHRGAMKDHIGSSSDAPFKVDWNTEWIPDQSKPITLMALVTDKDGVTHASPIVEDLSLGRNHSVQLVKPYGQPRFWTTRGGAYSEFFSLPFEMEEDDEAQMFWHSWSPCYSEGIAINGVEQAAIKGLPCYDAHWHEEKVKNNSALQKGENQLTTNKTPLHNGQMVHGMDVQWPGIMLKIKRSDAKEKQVTFSTGVYESRAHYIVHTPKLTYYYDRAGGGFSRIIDPHGNDWVTYKNEPWNEYPASAASSYRGLPNLVFQSASNSGAGHPGHDRCTSELVNGNTIRTVSKDGLWQWEWTFRNDHAVLDIQKTQPNTPYWFLYEGTPGGRFNPAIHYYGTNQSGPLFDAPDFQKNTISWGNFQWAYFGNKDLANTFFVAQINEDTATDMMSYLGDSDKGVKSNNGMTVFGFGRGENNKALLNSPNSFVIGLYPHEISNGSDHNKIGAHIVRLIKKNNK